MPVDLRSVEAVARDIAANVVKRKPPSRRLHYFFLALSYAGILWRILSHKAGPVAGLLEFATGLWHALPYFAAFLGTLFACGYWRRRRERREAAVQT